MPKKKRIGIIGATGFTGSELVRILHHHPEVEIALITSESRAGERFSDVHPFFRDIVDIELHKADAVQNANLDLVFLALPHGVSMDYVKQFRNEDFKIVDLSGDFRLSGPGTYEQWYNKEHVFPEAFAGAAFGIPELYAKEIQGAKLIANPGCYPTSAILGLAPLMKQKLIDPSYVIVDSKSGVTGAGVKAKAVNHYSSVNENFKAYGIKTHRHSIEIQENLEKLSGQSVKLQFTPHLLPVDRGILSTIYAKPSGPFTEADLKKVYNEFYASAPFVRLLDQSPTIKEVRGTNYCDICVAYDERTDNIIVISAIDNLVKGAAGQAVQNMNVLYGWDEKTGLQHIPLNP